MATLNTDKEKELWVWLWKSQQEIGKRLLREANDLLVKEGRQNEWPAMQEWDDLSGSSQAIFLRQARELVGIPDEIYLYILRSNFDLVEDLQ